MLMLVARKNLKERLGAILEDSEATRALRGPTFPVYGGVPVGQVTRTQVTSESRPSQVGPLSPRGPAFSESMPAGARASLRPKRAPGTLKNASER